MFELVEFFLSVDESSVLAPQDPNTLPTILVLCNVLRCEGLEGAAGAQYIIASLS